MKKIIGGAKYDTTTAKNLGGWSNGCNTNDFNYCSEDLYRTKAGRYFLHGDGGAMSIYSKSYGNNNRGGSEEIIPMSRESAQEWAEEKLTGDEYEEAFGEVAEYGRETLNLTVSPQLKQKLWELAEQGKVSVSSLVEGMLGKAVE